MGFIQEQMIAKTSNTTRLVDKLLFKGLVDRQVCPQNRRKMEVTITEKGLQLLEIVDTLVEEAEEKITAAFSQEEKEQLYSLLEKFKTPNI